MLFNGNSRICDNSESGNDVEVTVNTEQSDNTESKEKVEEHIDEVDSPKKDKDFNEKAPSGVVTSSVTNSNANSAFEVSTFYV